MRSPVGPDTPAPVRRSVSSARVTVLRPGGAVERPDTLVTEEPMEIRVGWPGHVPEPVAVTMRTPGHDFELAVGFLLAEGVVAQPATVASARYCVGVADEQRYNVVSVDLRSPARLDATRSVVVGSSCGICGTATLDQLERRCTVAPACGPVAESVLVALPDALRTAQPVFEQTGGLHAAGLFDTSGRPVAVREDIGRHNVVDKLVGWAALGGSLPLDDHVLMVSGRLSFEIIQKAGVAGIGLVAAVSAPSNLAVRTAERLGITLAAFVRGGRANLYSHPRRVRVGR